MDAPVGPSTAGVIAYMQVAASGTKADTAARVP